METVRAPSADIAPPPPGTGLMRHRHGRFGNSNGINTSSAVGEDGWLVPAPVRLADGTRLQLFKDGEALLAAYEAIKSARSLICLEVYIFASDDTGRAFADALCAKARAGVKVHVIYDSFGSIYSDSGMFRQMRRCGIRLQEFHPILPWDSRFSWRPLNRDHRKLLVIDKRIAGIGGLNIGAEYAGSWVVPGSAGNCDAWRDNGVGIMGPGAAMFQAAFARSWNYVIRGGRIAKAQYSAHLTDGELGVLSSVPTFDSPLRPSLCRLMQSARRSISMTMAYFVPDDELIDELCRAARRGARVRLMLPGRSDVPLTRIAGRSFYELLLSRGVEIYERQGCVLHSKTLVVDGQITVMGSTNLDYRSIEFNCEISAVIRSQPFGSQMETLFEHDVRFSKKIDLNEWRRRPKWDRFVQSTVSRARYWM